MHKTKSLFSPFLYRKFLFFCILGIFIFPHGIFAKGFQTIPVYTNPETNYCIYLQDAANLLTPSEEETLIANMQIITGYGNAAFVSIDQNPYHNTEDYAKNYVITYFGSENGIVFLIDMEERYLWIYSSGELYDVITTAYANTITDNVYRYASNQEYFTCADTAFSQVSTLLEGHKIAQPMKYISNLLLALILAMLFHYILVMSLSKKKVAQNKQILNNIYTNTTVKNTSIKFLHQTKQYNPPPPPPPANGNDNGHSGGSHSGGGHSGGGGGHRF